MPGLAPLQSAAHCRVRRLPPAAAPDRLPPGPWARAMNPAAYALRGEPDLSAQHLLDLGVQEPSSPRAEIFNSRFFPSTNSAASSLAPKIPRNHLCTVMPCGPGAKASNLCRETDSCCEANGCGEADGLCSVTTGSTPRPAGNGHGGLEQESLSRRGCSFMHAEHDPSVAALRSLARPAAAGGSGSPKSRGSTD